MKKVRLGRTNLKVSRVGLGGIPLQRPSEEKAIELIQYALDCGMNIIDTSIGYGDSEIRIGKAIKNRRDDVYLITRTGATNAERMKTNFGRSMERLQTDFIDIYELHGINSEESYQEVFEEDGSLNFMKEAKEQGKIGFIGFTTHRLELAIKAVKSGEFDVILYPLNIVNNDAVEELIPLTKKLDVGFTAMKPYAGGRLTDASLVMKYLLQFDNVVPVPGIERKEEIDQIIEVLNGDLVITPQDTQQMEKIRDDLGTKFCQWCGYCKPGCPEEIDIPFVINAELMWSLWPPERLNDWYKGKAETARNCIECGDCEEACPYDLSLREMIKIGASYIEEHIE